MARGLILAAVALASACGGGGGQTATAVLFQINAVTPSHESAGVGLTQEVNLFFSKSVSEASLTPESLQVVAESGDVIAGDRLLAQFSSSVVRFLPRSGYLPLAVHRIRVTTAVQDLQGNLLDREYEFEFQAEAEGPVLPVPSQIQDYPNLLRSPRWLHRMTLLASHRFLITGGYGTNAGSNALATAESLVPALESSAALPTPMLQPRAAHVQILLQDGRVLLAGGESSTNPFVPLASCEIFDPDPLSAGFALAAPMNVARSFAHAALLPDGRVLVTGGQSAEGGGIQFRTDAEIYDPATDTWTLVGAAMGKPRTGHFTATLPQGQVLVIGGPPGQPIAELFDPPSETFGPTSTFPFHEHFFGAGTVLNDGRVFVAGGNDSVGISILDPVFGFLGGLNAMQAERTFATATAFPDGRVLIVGGFNIGKGVIHDTVDLFFPIGVTGRLFRVPGFQLPRLTTHHTAGLGPDGRIWIAGGFPGLRQVVAIAPEPDD